MCVKNVELVNSGFTNLSQEGEWNVYKDDSGNYAKNTQRCRYYIQIQIHIQLEELLLPGSKNTLMAKLQIQQTFSHKQKTYWLS